MRINDQDQKGTRLVRGDAEVSCKGYLKQEQMERLQEPLLTA